MRKPKAQSLAPSSVKTARSEAKATKMPPARHPKAFSAKNISHDTIETEQWLNTDNQLQAASELYQKRPNRILQLALWTGALLISLAIALLADRLIADLFARYDWLGWVGLVLSGLFVVAIFTLGIREILALASLKNLDNLRTKTQKTLETGLPRQSRMLVLDLRRLYQSRPDQANALQKLDLDLQDELDGGPMLHATERHLMAPLDAKAKEMTAAAARRVAIVTAISPRAIVDIAFVAYESLKLARNIATLYGARPGFFGSWRLAKEILTHLAVTGGVALGDSVVQQLLGHGLAAKLSARLGEGLVNGLMSVRVGIATMRVTRPMPFDRLKQPKVMDFMGELASITKDNTK